MDRAEHQRPAQAGPPPLAIVNGTVFTAAPDRRRAQAVAMTGGVITAVGSTREVLAALPHAEVVERRGRDRAPRADRRAQPFPGHRGVAGGR